jgi:hypothetical protein
MRRVQGPAARDRLRPSRRTSCGRPTRRRRDRARTSRLPVSTRLSPGQIQQPATMLMGAGLPSQAIPAYRTVVGPGRNGLAESEEDWAAALGALREPGRAAGTGGAAATAHGPGARKWSRADGSRSWNSSQAARPSRSRGPSASCRTPRASAFGFLSSRTRPDRCQIPALDVSCQPCQGLSNAPATNLRPSPTRRASPGRAPGRGGRAPHAAATAGARGGHNPQPGPACHRHRPPGAATSRWSPRSISIARGTLPAGAWRRRRS